MTDNEIIKALECCVQGCSSDCPLYLTPIGITCEKLLHKNIFNLINRQQAEIERYKGVIKLLENDVRTAKAEAVKEFAKLIKEESDICYLGSIKHKAYRLTENDLAHLMRRAMLKKDIKE